jgi:hypothetical protein
MRIAQAAAETLWSAAIAKGTRPRSRTQSGCSTTRKNRRKGSAKRQRTGNAVSPREYDAVVA